MATGSAWAPPWPGSSSRRCSGSCSSASRTCAWPCPWNVSRPAPTTSPAAWSSCPSRGEPVTAIPPVPFDPGAYKERSRRVWNRAAGGWHRWGPVIEAWLRPATEAMMDMAGIGPDHRVLDVGAGAGEPAATIARRVGPGGVVVAADISPAMVELADRYARLAGLSNVLPRVMDGDALAELPPASFDA